MKPTTANVDKEAAHWSLSWQPDGRRNSFNKEAILASAPPTSGVYGLFNFDCQVFIGASGNIREALLRHLRESDFQSQHLRPTGFTFEPCALELCKPKVDELIARFRPVLQTEAALTESWSLSNSSMASEVGPSAKELKSDTDHHEFPVHEGERQPKVRGRFQFKRLGTALAVILVGSVMVIFYLGVPADYAIQKRAHSANPISGQTEIGLGPQNVASIDTPVELPNEKAKLTAARPDAHASGPTRNTTMQLAAKSTPVAGRSAVRANPGPIAHSTESGNLGKKWSVQISATPAKEIADTLVQKLKAKGYDGYLVQTEVKGQTYHRVRVGHFDAREKAEAVRQSLARQEDYRDAYLAGD
ncbi:MAG TPA: SPOR domain-containing protein [Candidatus Binatia bacterium]